MPCYIIAEMACTHQGRMELAIRLIDIAIAAKADCVKTQVFQPHLIPNVTEQERKYLDKCELSPRNFEQLRDYCKGQIDFMLTPFDLPSIKVIKDLQLTQIKIPSGRLYDRPFVDAIIKTNIDMIISTGMCEYEDIKLTKRRFPKNAKWLHCTSAYPLEYKDCNLGVLRGKMFDGLSDHTLCTDVPSIAVAIGAKIIEKHFTLRRTMPGPDQKVSLEPIELCDMVRKIRDVESMLGDGRKKIEEAEQTMLYRKVGEPWYEKRSKNHM